jgi:hypothetical protein
MPLPLTGILVSLAAFGFSALYLALGWVVLTFDHKDKKKGAIANLVHTMAHRKFAWEKILEEIAKCEVRCFNCHMRRAAIQLGRYKWREKEKP